MVIKKSCYLPQERWQFYKMFTIHGSETIAALFHSSCSLLRLYTSILLTESSKELYFDTKIESLIVFAGVGFVLQSSASTRRMSCMSPVSRLIQRIFREFLTTFYSPVVETETNLDPFYKILFLFLVLVSTAVSTCGQIVGPRQAFRPPHSSVACLTAIWNSYKVRQSFTSGTSVQNHFVRQGPATASPLYCRRSLITSMNNGPLQPGLISRRCRVI